MVLCAETLSKSTYYISAFMVQAHSRSATTHNTHKAVARVGRFGGGGDVGSVFYLALFEHSDVQLSSSNEAKNQIENHQDDNEDNFGHDGGGTKTIKCYCFWIQ